MKKNRSEFNPVDFGIKVFALILYALALLTGEHLGFQSFMLLAIYMAI